MKNFVVHDAQGNILRTGSCPADMLQLQAREGETVIEGQANDLTHQVIRGKIQRRATPLPAMGHPRLKA